MYPPSSSGSQIGGVVRIVFATLGVGGLDDVISPGFARASTFTIVDVSPDGTVIRVDVFPNTFARGGGGGWGRGRGMGRGMGGGMGGGFGYAIAQWIASTGARAVVAGNFGQGVVSWLQQFGIRPVTLYGMRVRDAIPQILKYLGVSP